MTSCSACGHDVMSAAAFCHRCGAKQDVTPSTGRDAAGGPGLRAQAIAAGKAALKTKLGQEVATGAAVGAVIAIPIPLVGPVTGAAVGAGMVLWKRYFRS